MNTTKKCKLQKLDRRMKGYRIFPHRVIPFWFDDFLSIRHQLTTTLGPGCEIDVYNISKRLGLGCVWGWDTNEYGVSALYVSEEQLTILLLSNSIDISPA